MSDEKEGAALSWAAPSIRLVRMDEPGLLRRRLRHLLRTERADDAQIVLLHIRRIAGAGVERAGGERRRVLTVELAFPLAIQLLFIAHEVRRAARIAHEGTALLIDEDFFSFV